MVLLLNCWKAENELCNELAPYTEKNRAQLYKVFIRVTAKRASMISIWVQYV